VTMEACGSAPFWAKKIQALGHRVALLPPHQVRPYVLRNKTDRTDTKGMLEADRNEDIHPVPVKTVEQQMITSLRRMRAAWIEKMPIVQRLRSIPGIGLITATGLVAFPRDSFGSRMNVAGATGPLHEPAAWVSGRYRSTCAAPRPRGSAGRCFRRWTRRRW